MANAQRGEAALTVDGVAYTLKWGVNAQAEAETLLDLAWGQIAPMMQEEPPRAAVVRAVAWAAFRRHHPDLSLEDVGDLLDAAPEEVGEALGQALMRAAPAGAGDKGNPPKAGRSTGRKRS